MPYRTRYAVAVLLLAAACRPAPARDAGASPEALLEADRQFAVAVSQGRLEAWVAAFDSGGIQLREGEPYAAGHETIRSYMAPVFADTSWHLSWVPDRAFVSRSGDMGYTLGRYRSVHRDSAGRRLAGTGQYVTIWKRQADGGWKVAFDGGAPDGPSAPIAP